MVSTVPLIEPRTSRISPSQVFDAGYRDGLNGRTNYVLCSNAEYSQGRLAGYRANPNSLFNRETPQQAPLEQGWGEERLNAL